MNAKTSRSITDERGTELPAFAAFESWMNINRPVVAAMTELNGRFIEQVSKANSEWLGFINRRLNEDIAASQRIMECKTLQDVFSAKNPSFTFIKKSNAREKKDGIHKNTCGGWNSKTI